MSTQERRKVKVGVLGAYRGTGMINYCKVADNAELVAICDKYGPALEKQREICGDTIAYYTSFDELIEHEGLEAIFLCNYFHEHTPYAIKALEKNIHVLSECTSNATMADGVALVRATEKSKAIYMLSENYPFMRFNVEMRRVFRGGTLGTLIYAEGEYNHPIDPFDNKEIKGLRPYREHWRNCLPRSYYITHSLAPLMHITGATPIRVTAMPCYVPFPKDSLLNCNVNDRAAIITCLNDDDSVFRVTGCATFGGHGNFYRICGELGQIENRKCDGGRVTLHYNEWDKPEGQDAVQTYLPSWNDPDEELISKATHGGGDFLVIREFFDSIREGRQPAFDVYFATTMASVAILSNRSLLERGVTYDIPDFRREEYRKKYENDTLSPFYGTDGSKPTIECCSHPKNWTEEAKAEYDARIASV